MRHVSTHQERHQARVGSGDRLAANPPEGLTGQHRHAGRLLLEQISKHIGAKVKLAKGTKAEAAHVSDGLRFGTYYRAAGHLANPTTATFEQSADAPTAQQQAATFNPNCWVTIRRDGTTVIESSHSEQGQGILTGIMSAIVDEADSDWDKVEIYEAGLTSEAPYISHSITGGFTMMDDLARFRHAGATVRTMMKTAAANTWKVPVEEIETHKGVATHKASGKTATYGDLVRAARDLPVPTDITLKTRAEWDLIGKWVQRVDIPEKVDGSAIYPIDMDLPGMLTAVPVIGYTYGSTVRWYDDSDDAESAGRQEGRRGPAIREWLSPGIVGAGGQLLRRHAGRARAARGLEQLPRQSAEQPRDHG